jgi:hypothetical protein
MWEKLKAYGKWGFGLLGLLAAVLFGANTLRGRKKLEGGSDSGEHAGKADLVEAQAKETEAVNTKVDRVNEAEPAPKPTDKAKPIEDLIDEYEKL